jgi:hypothetical protein
MNFYKGFEDSYRINSKVVVRPNASDANKSFPVNLPRLFPRTLSSFGCKITLELIGQFLW